MSTIRWREGLPEIFVGMAFGLILSIFIGCKGQTPAEKPLEVELGPVEKQWTSEVYVGALVRVEQEHDVLILMFTTLDQNDKLDTYLIGNANKSDFHIGEVYTVVTYNGKVRYIFFGESSSFDFSDLEMVYDN